MTMTGLTPAEFTAALTAALHRLRVRRIQALFRRAHTRETHTPRGGGGGNFLCLGDCNPRQPDSEGASLWVSDCCGFLPHKPEEKRGGVFFLVCSSWCVLLGVFFLHPSQKKPNKPFFSKSENYLLIFLYGGGGFSLFEIFGLFGLFWPMLFSYYQVL